MDKLVFILDVDGVMTTGQFYYSTEGKIFKVFGPHDNDGLKLLKNKIEVKFVSADSRGFGISKKRIVEDMGFDLKLVSAKDRMDYLKSRYDFSNLIYMGDGYHDVSILNECFFGIAPKNARDEAKAVADYITDSNSGEGAVLDACLKIISKFKL